MAKSTPKFGELPFVQLTTTCTTVNIIGSAREKTSSSRVSLVLGGPPCRTLKVRVGQARFFAVRLGVRTNRTLFQSPRHQKSVLIFFISSFPRIFPPTTPMPSYSHRLDALIAGASSKKAGSILRKVEKTSATPAGYRWFSSSCVVSIMIPVRCFLCATSPPYVAQDSAGPISHRKICCSEW
jgi:hypothetical protein